MRSLALGVVSAVLGVGLGLAIHATASSPASATVHTQSPSSIHSVPRHPLVAASIRQPQRHSVAASALGDAAVQVPDLPPTSASEQVYSAETRAHDLPTAPPVAAFALPYTQQRDPGAAVRAMFGWAAALGATALGAWALVARRRQDRPQPIMPAGLVEEGGAAYRSFYEFRPDLPGSPSALTYPTTAHPRARPVRPTNFVAETLLPTSAGGYRVRSYKRSLDGTRYTDPIAIVTGDPAGAESVPVRVHATGAAMGSPGSDCAQQLSQAMDFIQDEGCGIVIYLHKEGRGIALANVIAANGMQGAGAGAEVSAPDAPARAEDGWDHTAVRDILADLGPKSIELMTNSPQKVQELRSLGIDVDKQIP